MIEYTRIITDEEEKMLLNDLLDITEWIDKAIAGKINGCFKRAAKQYDELAKKENLETVPTQDIKKVEILFKRPDYLNRAERDALTDELL